ncbi:MAG: nucleoside kinase [Clostridiaceae bacterium]
MLSVKGALNGYIEVGTKSLSEIVSERKGNMKPILARRGGEYFELNECLNGQNDLMSVYIDDYVGNKAYERTLSMILVTAYHRLFQDHKIVIDHSISKGLYCWVEDEKISLEDIHRLSTEMKRIVKMDYPIEKVCFKLEDALELFKKNGEMDKYLLLKDNLFDSIKMYSLLDHVEYFYGKMAVSTGSINMFELVPYRDGFVMVYPTINEPESVKVFTPQDKLFEIFEETAKWDELIGINYVGYLNEKIKNNETRTLINVTEALHEKKIAYIADDIRKRKNVRIILIAGPSSSGKTTFAYRLGIQLRVNGIIPMPISMDDYFLPRRLTPLKEDGSYDFESVEALDLKIFEVDMMRLLAGETIKLPRFNFKTGEREESAGEVSLPENGVLIIEGIHGLNPKILQNIENRFKFKIYISALTVLNLDRHNRIATTDVRKLRRIARDHISRGYSPEETLEIFPSVTLGEKKYIFPHQEEADAMFNSTLFYELAVLKKHTIVELQKIGKESRTYEEAKRLITILRLFVDVDDAMVPTNSILREFIGGSQFFDY